METNTISITNNTTATPCSNTITLDKTLVATVENPWHQSGKLDNYGNLNNICLMPIDTISISEEHLSYKQEKAAIKNVIFSGPATIVIWSDGDKTIVKKSDCEAEMDKEKGLAMAIIKKAYKDAGKEGSYFRRIFGAWIKDEN